MMTRHVVREISIQTKQKYMSCNVLAYDYQQIVEFVGLLNRFLYEDCRQKVKIYWNG